MENAWRHFVISLERNLIQFYSIQKLHNIVPLLVRFKKHTSIDIKTYFHKFLEYIKY